MYEIEAKVGITKSDFERLQKELEKIADFKGNFVKKDIYYDDTKKAHTRLRELNNQSIFSFKIKEIAHGIESNIEIEWGVKDRSKWMTLLKSNGINPSIRKFKKTKAYQSNGFVIELNHISKLGYYLEIERIVKTKNLIPKAKKELIEIFNKLGYSHKDFEKRYYIDLLQELNS